MEEKRYIVAIEIATSHISGVAATVSDNGDFSPVSKFYEEKTDGGCVAYGIITNVEDVKAKVRRIIEQVEQDPGMKDKKVTGCYVGLCGRSMHSETVTVTHSISQYDQVSDEVIDGILQEAVGRFAREGLAVIATLPRKYEVDCREVANPIGVVGNQLSAVVDVIVSRPTLGDNIDKVFNGLNIRLLGLVITPIALADIILSDEQRSLGCMLVDMGSETTKVLLYKGGHIAYLNVLPMGSHNITLDLMSLNMVESEAEKIKTTYGDVLGMGRHLNATDLPAYNTLDIENYISARTGEIVENILNQLVYAKLSVKDLCKGIVLVGRGAKLKGLPEALRKSAGSIDVQYGSIPHVNRQDYTDNIQLLAILDAATRLIGDGETCVDSKVEIREEDPVDDDAPKKSRGERRGFGGIFRRLFNGDVFKEDDEEHGKDK